MSQIAPSSTFPQAEAAPKTSSGDRKFLYCCGCGCVLVLLVVIGLGATAYYGLSKAVELFLHDAPMEFATIDATSAETDEVIAKIAIFGAAEPGEEAELRLTERELNIWLTTDDAVDQLSEFGRFDIVDGQLFTDVSFSLDEIFNGEFLAGKWWIGRIGWELTHGDGEFDPAPSSYDWLDELRPEMKDSPRPVMPLDARQMRQTMRDMLRDPQFKRNLKENPGIDIDAFYDFMQKADEVIIEDDELVLRRD